MLADRIVGTTPSWPGTAWPWHVVFVAGAVLGFIFLGGAIAKRLGFHAVMNGAWFWLAVMSLLIAAEAPLAASPFLVPLIIASLLKIAVTLIDRAGTSPWWIAAGAGSAFAGVVYLAGLVPLMAETQGYQVAPAFYVP